VSSPIERISVPEFAATGSLSMLRFQGFVCGTGQSGDENGCGEDVDGSHTAYIGATAGAP